MKIQSWVYFSGTLRKLFLTTAGAGDMPTVWMRPDFFD